MQRLPTTRAFCRAYSTLPPHVVPPPSVAIPKQKKTFYDALLLVRQAPASHLVSFLVLHELTAVVPLPILFFTFQSLDVALPLHLLPDGLLEQSTAAMSKLLTSLGVSSDTAVDSGKTSSTLLHLAGAYALVKVAMPLRIGLCLYWTPWAARWVIEPMAKIRQKWKRS
jgi:hypothetical protein